ncbi:MAG: hypothetical protein IKS19_05765 [Clostridia bacterium]|nr:hypothetical protein [Clostridia bacterium]
MNGLINIQEKIISDAKAKADEIISQAQNDAGEILEQARIQSEADCRELIGDSEKRALAIERSAESAAHLRGKNLLLKTKGELMNQVIEQAHESILALPDKEYFDIICKMAAKYSHDSEGQMLLNKKDLSRLPAGFEAKIAKAVRGTLKISDKPCDIDGGFILTYGGIEENCSFDALFKAKYDKIRDIISTVLFG